MLIASYSAPTDRSTGIICDQTISLDGFYTRQDYPELLRRIRFKDPESGKTLVFITNNFSLPAATICALYKSRWQVELFFKWIKQHLRIKQFYGTSENAVKTQIWIAVSVYALVAIVKKRLDLDASLYTLLQILSVDPSRKSGGALHRLHCFCLEFDGACEVQRRVPTDWIIEPIDVSGYGSFSLAS